MDIIKFEEIFNAFSFKLLKNLRTESKSNMLFSPILVHSSLTKLNLCTAGKTSSQICTLLNYSNLASKRDPARNYRILLNDLRKERYIYFSDNLIFDQRYPLKDECIQKVTKYFGKCNEIYKVNFKKQDLATGKINAIIESNTDHVIQSVIKYDTFATESCVVIVQVMDFKGEWTKGFNRSETSLNPFWINDKETVPVQMMNGRNEFKYAKIKELNSYALELDFYKSSLNLLILLPRNKTGLNSLEDKICKKGKGIIKNIVNRLESKGVNVALPKFKLEIEHKNIKTALSKMDLSSLFSKKCDFSEVLESTSEPVQVSKIIHKSIIKLSETGREVPVNPMLFDNNTPSFVADHPFMFFLKFKESQVIVLSGSIRKPEPSDFKGQTSYQHSPMNNILGMMPQMSMGPQMLPMMPNPR